MFHGEAQVRPRPERPDRQAIRKFTGLPCSITIETNSRGTVYRPSRRPVLGCIPIDLSDKGLNCLFIVHFLLDYTMTISEVAV